MNRQLTMVAKAVVAVALTIMLAGEAMPTSTH
jgi:hypothetical protein